MSIKPDSEVKSEDPATTPAASSSQADMAQAFRDLARGEQQAAALERNLTNLEKKLDALLAHYEGAEGSDEAVEATGLKQHRDNQKT